MAFGRALRVVTTTVVAVGLVAAPAGAADAAHAPHGAAGRAVASYAALQRWFATDHGLYREQYPSESSDNPYSYEWPFSQAHMAALDLASLPGRHYTRALARHDAAQQHYWSDAGTTGLPGFASGVMPPLSTGGDFFYDDNEWVGLEDVQHLLSAGRRHDAGSLAEAEQIFRLVVSGWDTDADHADPGGVFWTQATWSTDRNTVSNMPGAELGLRLYQLTGRAYYLHWALRMYRWTNRYLQQPNGLYADHVSLDGTVEGTVWSYNQGVPVGVNVLLYEVTGRQHYLAEAERIADAAYDYFVAGGRLDAQPPYFNSIYFANLLLLSSVTGERRWVEAMRAWADRVWTQRRDPATGLFHFAAGGDPHVQMIEQAAMTQVYALLALRPRQWASLY